MRLIDRSLIPSWSHKLSFQPMTITFAVSSSSSIIWAMCGGLTFLDSALSFAFDGVGARWLSIIHSLQSISPGVAVCASVLSSVLASDVVPALKLTIMLAVKASP